MGNTVDKFSRLAALRPARGVSQTPAALRAPDETDALSHLLGAGIARNHYGEHLAIRHWFSTPEFSEPSAVALDLLTKASGSESGRHKPKSGPPQKDGPYRGSSRDDTLSRRMRTAVQNPDKWLFLD